MVEVSDPQTPEQWQEAVDIAHGALAVELSRILGFLEPGGEVNIERCAEILGRGREMGYAPAEAAIRDWLSFGNSDEADHERILRVVTTAWEMSGEPELEHIVPFLSSRVSP